MTLKEMGGMRVCDKVWVSSPLIKSQSSLVDEIPWKGSVTIEFLLQDLSLGR